MLGLNKKITLATAVAALSVSAHAELEALDEATMSEMTGQAGITIDIENKFQIGEFAYHDAGSLLLTGIRFGGNRNEDGSSENTDVSGMSLMDNHRLYIDIAGSGADDTRRVKSGGGFYADNELAYGFSELAHLAQLYVDESNTDPGFASLVAGTDSENGLAVDSEKVYGDGDLVIHFDFVDPWVKSAQGNYAAYANAGQFATDTYANFDLLHATSVDYTFEIDAIGIAGSAYASNGNADGGLSNIVTDGVDRIGSTTGQTFTEHGGYTSISAAVPATVLISNLTIDGYFGPGDLHIENDGNGFDGSGDLAVLGLTDVGNADSVITWGNYIKITDLDVYVDIAGLALKDLQIHNERGSKAGLDGTSSFGFAHVERTIYAVKDNVLNIPHAVLAGNAGTPQFIIDAYVDGIAINTEFVGDKDIKHLSFGDTNESIGEIYLTDIYAITNWTISAH